GGSAAMDSLQHPILSSVPAGELRRSTGPRNSGGGLQSPILLHVQRARTGDRVEPALRKRSRDPARRLVADSGRGYLRLVGAGTHCILGDPLQAHCRSSAAVLVSAGLARSWNGRSPLFLIRSRGRTGTDRSLCSTALH